MPDEPHPFISVLWETKAKAGKAADLKSFIERAITATRNDAGNIEYEAHEVEGDPGTFIIYERWVSREALDGHLNAPRMQHLVPELLQLIEGSIEEGMRILHVFRPTE